MNTTGSSVDIIASVYFGKEVAPWATLMECLDLDTRCSINIGKQILYNGKLLG